MDLIAKLATLFIVYSSVMTRTLAQVIPCAIVLLHKSFPMYCYCIMGIWHRVACCFYKMLYKLHFLSISLWLTRWTSPIKQEILSFFNQTFFRTSFSIRHFSELVYLRIPLQCYNLYRVQAKFIFKIHFHTFKLALHLMSDYKFYEVNMSFTRCLWFCLFF